MILTHSPSDSSSHYIEKLLIPTFKIYLYRNVGPTSQESRVTISVGEKPGFLYTVNGRTYSDKKITVSGEYYNNEIQRYGFAHLFMGVNTGIAYFEVYPEQNTLTVYVENQYRDQFYFQILVPPGITVYDNDILVDRFNGTALIFSGPSRSSIRHPRAKTISKSEIKDSTVGEVKV